MEQAAKPLWEQEELGGKNPKIDKFFFVAFNGGGFAGATAADPDRVTQLRPVLSASCFLRARRARICIPSIIIWSFCRWLALYRT